MKRVIAIAAGATAVVALAAGCSTKDVNSGPAPGPTPSATGTAAPVGGTAAASGAAVLRTASTPLGTVLVDGAGRTLYLFEADTGTASTCTGVCAQAWPPDLTDGTPRATGLNTALVGTTVRADHRSQVTYHGHPLYYFAGDTRAGQTGGQAVTDFGAAWYVVAPAGTAVTTTPTARVAPPSSPSPSATPRPASGGYGY